MIKLALVALGGGIGATTRYLVANWAAERFGADFPYGTLIVNVVGCFIIGAFMTLTTERIIVSPYWRLLVTVGFVGGLTTFSSFSYETLNLIAEGSLTAGLLNLLLNCSVGFFATWLGIIVSRAIW